MSDPITSPHSPDCDSILSPSDIVAGITAKPCNCPLSESTVTPTLPIGCPFCESKNVYVKHTRPWWVACDDCGAEGPYRTTRRGAVAAWNHRVSPSALHPDTRRLDWLETKVVNVRTRLVYGSRNLFWASPPDDECAEPPSDLRAKIDAAISAAIPTSEDSTNG